MEMKVDPCTGMLTQVIVLEEPPLSDAQRRLPIAAEAQNRAPKIDLRYWEEQDRLDGSSSEHFVASLFTELAFVRTRHQIGIVFSGQSPARYVYCGDVVVAISEAGELAEIAVSSQP
ncbi:hypothetical protein [Streptomyces orinoci]|uniref:Uncharacterized protein n=1 Tax=Streptomyces orinoci TaxID=67339 RepID=A0ABV3K4E3_STRON|nr:hypothetical protein [Streptomyces orinoci]